MWKEVIPDSLGVTKAVQELSIPWDITFQDPILSTKFFYQSEYL